MSFVIWSTLSGMAAGSLLADNLHNKKADENAKKPPGLMTKFRHAVMPMPKTPEDRAQAILHELTKLHPINQSGEEPDYPYIDKLLQKGVSGADKELYRIGEAFINAKQSDLAKTLLATTPEFPVNYMGGSQGETLLHCAVLRADFGVVRHLLDMNADSNAKTRGGNTPLDIATRRGFSPTATILSDMLTDYGAQKSEKPATHAQIEEKWRGDMREQIQDIIELDQPVTRPKTASFSKKPGSTP